MKTAWNITLVCLVWSFLAAGAAQGHFLVLLPSSDVVAGIDSASVDLKVLFTHPMDQGPVMEMAMPRQFGVLVNQKKRDLLASLRPQKVEGKTTYVSTARLIEPGDYVFYVEPAPYWEPSEEKMIIHYTKVVVNYLGAQGGWEATVGFPVEIEPLVRPYGLWSGNSFRGVVKRNGRPVPFATIEVEYYNEGRQVRVPNDAFVTQVIKADAAGVFCYTMPRPGWWGFAALVPGHEKLKAPNGKMVDVELGGLIWVRTVKMQ